MTLLHHIKQHLSAKNVFSLLTLCFFAIQPWNHQAADALWLLLSLASLVYIATKKIQGYDFEIPNQLKVIFGLLTLMPIISVISYLASPLNTLTPDLLEPDSRWLLVIAIIIAMRDLKTGPYWILAMLGAYAISTFISATIETNYLTNLNIRANGDENAVSYGMFNATITIMLFAFLPSVLFKFKELNIKIKYFLKALTILLTLCAGIASLLTGTKAAAILIPTADTVICWLT